MSLSVSHPAGPTWRDRLLAWRDGAVASPRFRRLAAAFPLTRPIARRRTRALFDLCAGFVYAQVLLACVQLRLFDILAERPASAAALAPRLGLSAEAAERLLAAAVSLRLAARRGGGRYGLGPLGAAMVGNAAIGEMVLHHPMLYADLQDPVALLRGEAAPTALRRYWSYAARRRSARSRYTALMAASQPLVADEVLDAYRVGRHRICWTWAAGTAASCSPQPHARQACGLPCSTCPASLPSRRRGWARRARVVGGDCVTDALPPAPT